MNGEINRGNARVSRDHKLARKLVVHDVGLRMEQVAPIIDEAKRQRIAIALCPGMDVLRKLVECIKLEQDTKAAYHKENRVYVQLFCQENDL